jgi:nucleoid DNA-binding protein
MDNAYINESIEDRVNRVYKGAQGMVRAKTLPTIARLNKEQMAIRMQEITGMSSREAQNAINAVCLALSTWLESMIRDIPEETQAVATIAGFGRWTVKYSRKGRASAWRERNGIPQRPAILQALFNPGRSTYRALKAANAPIRKKYAEEYRPARDAYMARNPNENPHWQGKLAINRNSLRQSVLDEIAELEGKQPPGAEREIETHPVIIDSQKVMANLPWEPKEPRQAIAIIPDPEIQDAYQLLPEETKEPKPQDQEEATAQADAIANDIYEKYCGPNPNDKTLEDPTRLKTYNTPDEVLERVEQLKRKISYNVKAYDTLKDYSA